MNDGVWDGKGMLDANTKAQIAFKLITEGSAAAVGDMARTSEGYANTKKRVTAQVEDAAAAFGEKLLPAATGVWNAFGKLLSTAQDFLKVPLSEKLEEEQIALNVLVSSLMDVNIDQKRRNDLIQELQRTYPDFLGNLDAEKVTNEQLAERLSVVNDQMVKKILLQQMSEENQKNLSLIHI